MSDTESRRMAGRELASFRQIVPKVCPQCGREFEGFVHSIYCRPACGCAAYWDRNRADLNRKRREKYQRGKTNSS